MNPAEPPGRGTAAAGVASPCTGVCRIAPASGRCEGCHRQLDEIARWSAMTDAQRLAVWALLPERRAEAARPDAA